MSLGLILVGLVVWLLFGYITPFPGWIDLAIVAVGLFGYGRMRAGHPTDESGPGERSKWLSGRSTYPSWVVPEFPVSEEPELRLEWYDGDVGRGFVLIDELSEEKLRWRSLQWGDGAKSINVVGEQHYLQELQDPSFSPGREVALVPEPENEFDPEAVAVYNKDLSLHIGYLPAESKTKKGALNRLKKDNLRAFVMWENREGRKRTGVRLLLTTENAALRVR